MNKVIEAKPPFANCKYQICDLPGQCRSEGKCHHPKHTPDNQEQATMSDVKRYVPSDEYVNESEDGWLYKCADIDPIIATLTAERDRLRDRIEVLDNQLAGCSVASIQNTHKSKADRIDSSNPYCSQSYIDVCHAVDREIRERERAEQAESRLQVMREALMNISVLYSHNDLSTAPGMARTALSQPTKEG